MDEDQDNQEAMLIKSLRHEVQHLTMQVKMLQQSVDSLKNRNSTNTEITRNHLGAWTIGQIKGNG